MDPASPKARPLLKMHSTGRRCRPARTMRKLGVRDRLGLAAVHNPNPRIVVQADQFKTANNAATVPNNQNTVLSLSSAKVAWLRNAPAESRISVQPR
jgi:hypothetical protein